MDDQENMKKLWKICEHFIREKEIGCVESIYQTDRVIEGAYEFIESVCGVVGYAPGE